MTATVEIPFVVVGDRRCLTHTQLVEMPWLHDFVRRFPACFRYDVSADVVWFEPPLDDTKKAADREADGVRN